MSRRVAEVTEIAWLGTRWIVLLGFAPAAAAHFQVRSADVMTVGNGADDLVGRLCAAFGQPRQGQSTGRILVPEMSFLSVSHGSHCSWLETHTLILSRISFPI